MIINNNLASLVAYNSLNSTNNSLQKSLQTLSTGLRINSSSDDSAGFAISNKMRSQIGGLDTAIRNSRDGISLLQTTEGALGETNSMLQRMRELAVQASNDTLTSQDRSYIQAEIDELKENIDRIANTTQFNSNRILDGSSGALWSSSDAGLRPHINGGLTSIDAFGQKVSSEGNYRIEVKADPGQAQVQKSNVYNLADVTVETRFETVEETVTETVTEEITEISTEIIYEDQTLPYSIYINDGVDTLNATSGEGWNFQDGVLTITGDGTYNIVGTGEPTTTRIVVASGVNAKVFLNEVNIQVDRKRPNGETSASYGMSAFDMTGATVDLYLKGVNYLKGGPNAGAGIYVPGFPAEDEATLTISSVSGDFSTDGVLNCEGGTMAACIGGSIWPHGYSGTIADGRNAGNITINGGTIIATTGSLGAGIGGGRYGYGGTIVINGGDITARAVRMGAGIGNGAEAQARVKNAVQPNDTKIIITGGTVRAYGGSTTGLPNLPRAGAGIGGCGTGGNGISPGSGAVGTILIKNGLVGSSVGASPGNEPLLIDKRPEAIGRGGGGEDWVVDRFADLETPAPREVPDLATIDVVAPKEVIKETTREVTHEITRVIGFTTKEITTEEASYKKLSEFKEFYNQSGILTVDPYQTITITQGNGRTASVTLYPTDTMLDVAEKINNAIADDLGQAMYADSHNKFCTIADGTNNTSESVHSREPVYDSEIWLRDEEGNYVLDENGNRITLPIEARFKGYNVYATMLVRSVIPGQVGELYFSGDEDLLNALGLNTIQEATETTFTASVYDAHSGRPISNGKATGSVFKSIIPPEIDIEIDPMTDIKASWDEKTKRYILSGNGTYSSTLHLKDNGTILQVGANSGEDMLLSFGDMSCSSLGVKQVIVTTSETAKRAISIIDRAINRVSQQRAQIGAYENALERNVDNLTTESANLTLTESRIRDADMSRTIMDFVKFQILNQAGTSMLAQANQLPQSVLSLLQ